MNLFQNQKSLDVNIFLLDRSVSSQELFKRDCSYKDLFECLKVIKPELAKYQIETKPDEYL